MFLTAWTSACRGLWHSAFTSRVSSDWEGIQIRLGPATVLYCLLTPSSGNKVSIDFLIACFHPVSANTSSLSRVGSNRLSNNTFRLFLPHLLKSFRPHAFILMLLHWWLINDRVPYSSLFIQYFLSNYINVKAILNYSTVTLCHRCECTHHALVSSTNYRQIN